MSYPVSVTSTANVDPNASSSLWGTFTSSPSYNKPAVDLSNPVHVAVVAVLVLGGLWLWKKKR